MRVLLDANVLLDSALQRSPWHPDADYILAEAQPGILELCVTTLTVANVFYISRRYKGVAFARQTVRMSFSAFEILAVSKNTLLLADSHSGSDFEDNIQIAAAMQESLDYIVTRDPAGFAASPIPIISPADFVKLLQATP